MKMAKGLKLLFLVAVLVLAAVAFFLVMRRAGSAAGGAEAELRALAAEPRPAAIEAVRGASSGGRRYPATVRAAKEAPLSFRVAGPLVAVPVQPGDRVRRGDLLMEIDRRDYDDAIRVLEAQLAGARAALEKARLDLERARPLLAEGVIAQAAFDGAVSAHDTSAASVRDIEGRLRIARHQLADVRLLAPFDGIVAAKTVDNHEMVAAGQVVLTLLDISSLDVRAEVPEDEMVRKDLVPGREALVAFSALPGRTFAARLKEWSAAPDRVTRTYAVTFSLAAPSEGQVLPGMTGELLWQAAGDGRLSVPVGALFSDEEGREALWVFDDRTSTASKRVVETGGLVGRDRVSVVKGLSGNERVVAAGPAFIVEGMKLRPLSR